MLFDNLGDRILMIYVVIFYLDAQKENNALKVDKVCAYALSVTFHDSSLSFCIPGSMQHPQDKLEEKNLELEKQAVDEVNLRLCHF